MLSTEPNVAPKSDYYFYQPSLIASKLYLYPMVTGHFSYLAGYKQSRNHYDSYLLMFINSGECFGTYGDKSFVAIQNQFVLIDCYKPHSYRFPIDSNVYWIHFDGPLAQAYYEAIVNAKGHSISIQNSQSVLQNMKKILHLFRESSPVKEAYVSSIITQILTELLTGQSDSKGKTSSPHAIERCLAYINEHFDQEISLETLAGEANLSPYYFTRIFTVETGFTPHQYILAARINSAKYKLDNLEIPIKDIAFSCGFNSESSFCTAFKKWVGMTPSQYRNRSIEY